ncbi:ribokinase [Shewanella sp. 202IG2-18]|uniref:ribokinase n=1 Tax=Parashewanella hymeniacidonis TaxID=2807618 RepID=UPI0019616544|nr:ribokinase [Parashewanella hymeniacidonis]MBM7073315.1 ribokinase [Parashewanella hymeniacidonis]
MSKVFFLASVNLDILSYLKGFPQSGQTISTTDSVFACGGKGANQAYACSQNNVKTMMLCKIGNDPFGEQIRTYLAQRESIETQILTSDKSTAIAQIFIRESDSQNLIVIISGANKDITKREVLQRKSDIQNSHLLAVQLENNIEAIAVSIEIAKQNKVSVLLNPAPYEPEIEPYLKDVDILTPNETEASELTGIEVTDKETAKAAAQVINTKYGINMIIITLGAQGVYYFNCGDSGFIEPFKANVIDTSGAGDAFNGAFAAYYCEHGKFETAIKYANAYASTAIEGKGASYMPNSNLAHKRFSQ